MGWIKRIFSAQDSFGERLLDQNVNTKQRSHLQAGGDSALNTPKDQNLKVKARFHDSFKGGNGVIGIEATTIVGKEQMRNGIEMREETIVASDHPRELQVAEASEKFDISPDKLRKLCNDKVIKSEKRRGRWFIDWEAIKQYKKVRG